MDLAAGPPSSSRAPSLPAAAASAPTTMARVAFVAALCASFAVGLALRLWEWREQIFADDEWHALDMIVVHDAKWIATHFGVSDYSIPMALYDKALSQLTTLTEAGMRAPMLVAGMLAVIGLPLLLRKPVGAPTAAMTSCFLAIAPFHVYLSRYARPYAITFLLLSVAMIAYLHVRDAADSTDPLVVRVRRRWLAAYVVCALFATWLSLVALPLAFGPIAIHFVEIVAGRRTTFRADWKKRAKDLVFLGCAMLSVPIALYLPACFNDFRSLAKKATHPWLDPDTLWGTLNLFAGNGSVLVSLAVFALAIAGWFFVRRRVALFLVGPVLLEVLAVVIFRPDQANSPVVMARYCFPVLLLVAIGLSSSLDRAFTKLTARARVVVAPLAVAALSVVHVVTGPIPSTYREHNDFTSHALFQYTYNDDNRYTYRENRLPVPEAPSHFYEELAALPPDSVVVVEAPFPHMWHQNPLPYAQSVHHQRLLAGEVDTRSRWVRGGEIPLLPNIDLENHVHVGDFDALAHKHVRYVIFHRWWPLESKDTRRDHQRLVARWIDAYEQRYGAPAFVDDDITVFDVTRPLLATAPSTDHLIDDVTTLPKHAKH